MLRALILCLIFLLPISAQAETAQFWQNLSLPLIEQGGNELHFTQEYRFDLFDFTCTDVRLALKGKKKICKWLECALGYKWIKSRDSRKEKFRGNHRLEAELNPAFPIGRSFLLTLRNRYQLTKDEHHPVLRHAVRQRQKLQREIAWGPFHQFAISNEVFFGIDRDGFDEDRFIPCELSWGKEHCYEKSAYGMVRWQKSERKWERQFVIGFSLAP